MGQAAGVKRPEPSARVKDREVEIDGAKEIDHDLGIDGDTPDHQQRGP